MKIQQEDSENQKFIIISDIETQMYHHSSNQSVRYRPSLLLLPLVIVLISVGYFLHASGEASPPAGSLPQGFSLSLEMNSYQPQVLQLGELIERIQRSQIIHLWFLPEKLFHYYQSNSRIMYFQTAYEIILPSCEATQHFKWSIDRENIREWNQHPEVIEWAFRYVRPGDHVLYYRPRIYHLLELTVLSKIVGERGSITVLNGNRSSVCMKFISAFQGLKAKIQYSNSRMLNPQEQYTVLIANASLLRSPALKGTLSPSLRALLFARGPAQLRQQQGDIIKRVIIHFSPFLEFFLSDSLAGQGFYSVLPQGQQPSSVPLLKQKADSVIRRLVESKYAKFKQQYKESIAAKQQFLINLGTDRQCLGFNAPRMRGGVGVSVYGHLLYDVSLQQLQSWERERQAVEWVRSQLLKQGGRSVYYQLSRFNLLAILQISLLLSPHTLILLCSAGQCDRIVRQIQEHQLTNIQAIPASDPSSALTAGMVVTDSKSLITQLIQADFLHSGSLLAYFTHTLPDSLALVRKLYVQHNLRQIITDEKYGECIGASYRHFFWTSWEPEGYYEVTPSHDVLYAFWAGHPGKLTLRKKLIIEEITSTTLQAKVLSPETFLPFSVPGSPIHPAFPLLTSVHKSDYMRGYLMHHYGGAYSDVKHLHVDLRPYVEKLKQDAGKLAMGYAEIHDFDVACFDDAKPTCREIRVKYRQIIGNCYYIFKKQSVITTDWANRVAAILDNKLEALKKNPPQVPRQKLDGNFTLPNGTRFTSKYPLRWAEIGGECLTRAQYKHLDKISAILPYIINVDYRVEDNLIEN